MKKYARNCQEAVAYIKRNYDVECSIDNPTGKRLYFADGGCAEYDNAQCWCGESISWRVYDENYKLIEEIIDCESCYDKADQHEQV